MKNYYECHVTFMAAPDSRPDMVTGWIFSKIDGDPVLGKGVKSYLTRQFPTSTSLDAVISRTEEAAMVLRNTGYDVLRTKVELVVYDSKQRKSETTTNNTEEP